MTDTILIDIGSYTIKYGLIGYHKPDGKIYSNGIVKNSIIQDIKKFCDIILIIINKIKNNERKILLLISLVIPSIDNYCQSIIKNINNINNIKIQQINFIDQKIISIYCSARYTGLVIDIGHDITRITPIYDNYIIESATKYSFLGGVAINKYLAKIHKKPYDQYNMSNNIEFDKLKKKLCNDDINNIIEVLFNPSLINYDMDNLIQLIKESINDCSCVFEVSRLLNNIILIGGTSTIPNLCKILKNKLKNHFKENIKLFAPKNRHYGTWIGGSILSILNNK